MTANNKIKWIVICNFIYIIDSFSTLEEAEKFIENYKLTSEESFLSITKGVLYNENNRK